MIPSYCMAVYKKPNFFFGTENIFTLKYYLIVYFPISKAHGHVAMDDDHGVTKFTSGSVTSAPTHAVSSSETIWCYFCIISKILT